MRASEIVPGQIAPQGVERCTMSGGLILNPMTGLIIYYKVHWVVPYNRKALYKNQLLVLLSLSFLSVLQGDWATAHQQQKGHMTNLILQEELVGLRHQLVGCYDATQILHPVVLDNQRDDHQALHHQLPVLLLWNPGIQDGQKNGVMGYQNFTTINFE